MNQGDSNKTFAPEALGNMTLGLCIETLHKYFEAEPYSGFIEELETINSNYQLMKNYMRNGYDDKMRQSMYTDMLLHVKRIAADAALMVKIKNDSAFTELYNKGRKINVDAAEILSELETYVQDVAFASFDIGGNNDATNANNSLASIYNKHYSYMDRLFSAIVTGGSWSKSKADDIAKVLLSPTIDIQDAQWLTSAITLATLLSSDFNKVRVLASIYKQAQDESLRQRGLVGFVFAVIECKLYLHEVDKLVEEMLKEESVRDEILETAIQVVFCNNAEKDNEYLERNIFPEIMKNRPVDITKTGIIEKEDDPMEDILNPDATDRKMDELEQSMRKMVDMQKAGADIYFGGFKQMKRYAFFYTMSNWFAPFNINHPAFGNISQEIKESSLLKMLFASNSFCDNDKYSLVLSMSSIFSKLPENIKDAVPGEIIGSKLMENKNNAAEIRRLYLQDLYRFFMLYPQKNSFDNVFSRHSKFLGEEPFAWYMPDELRTLVKFLVKRGDNALPLMLSFFDINNDADCMLLAYIYMKRGDNIKAYTYYYKVYQKEAANIKALKGAALTAFRSENYVSAAKLYDALINTHGEKAMKHQVYYCLSLLRIGDIDKAVSNLYRLSFEFTDNAEVIRALALGLVLQGKTDQAISNYVALQTMGANNHLDNGALAFCYGSKGEWTKATKAICARISAKSDEKFYEPYILENPSKTFNISKSDLQILLDIETDDKL